MTEPEFVSVPRSAIRSRLFNQFAEQGFWHANYVDLVWRLDGKEVREEGDWLKDVWYAARGAAAPSPEPRAVEEWRGTGMTAIPETDRYVGAVCADAYERPRPAANPAPEPLTDEERAWLFAVSRYRALCVSETSVVLRALAIADHYRDQCGGGK